MRCSLFLLIAVSVSLSVCLSHGSTRLHGAKTAERIKVPFGVNTPAPGGPGVLIPHRDGLRALFWILGSPLTSLERLKLQT